jgi:riboflavin kinase/FMN adenylyltransferase
LIAIERKSPRPAIVVIGTFDGVHLGHQSLIATARRIADAGSAWVHAITFDPSPRQVFRPDSRQVMLTDLPDRLRLLGEAGANQVSLVPFSLRLAEVPAEDFVAFLVERLGMVELVGGPDIALGRDRAGTAAVLARHGARLGYRMTVADVRSIGGVEVRSGAIRAALTDGRVHDAAAMLGRPYSISGEVLAGDRRGRTIGFPTANLRPPSDRRLPATGVYAIRARIGSDLVPGVANLGTRPTVNGQDLRLEAHILDFDADLYGRTIEIRFEHQLRGERRFANLDALKEQIGADIIAARAFFETSPDA